MTEITDITDQLPPAVQRFILHWGDMGDQWGVNRSVAQMTKAAAYCKAGGVGTYYGSNFVHMDSGPVRHWYG